MLATLLWISRQLALGEPIPTGSPTPIELTLVGGPELNPNGQGRASPVVVRIFELAATQAFESAQFQGLFEHPADVLKQDLVAQEELVLRPGEIQERNRSSQPQVQALGVMAAFRDVEHAVWHLTVPLRPGRRNFLLVEVDRDTIRVMPVDPAQP